MNKFIFCLIALLCAMLISVSSFGVIANPEPILFKNPDGTKLTIKLYGDEYFHWAETADGYTIVFNSEGVYEYAELDKGELVPSGIKAFDARERTSSQEQLLSKIPKGLKYSPSQLSTLEQLRVIRKSEEQVQRAFPTTGTRQLICILMGFADVAFTKTQAEFDNLFNQVNYTVDGAVGSVRDFYHENSYGQFDINVTVAGPYTATNNMAYYGGNDIYGYDLRPRELVTEAINFADSEVNYADFDNDNDGYVDGVYVIFAGYGEEAGASANAIWSHKWSISPVTLDGKIISTYSCSPELRSNSGTGITRIGVICHEFGHVLGAPDFYDTNYSTGGQYQGTGNWDLMASGSWGGGDGVCPAHHNGYTKWHYYNWITPSELNSSGHYALSNIEENQNSFYFTSQTAGEFWFIENRQQINFDASIPGHGMIIYHVDENGIATAGNQINATHPQYMYPVAANATGNPPTYGTINSSSCPFPGTGGATEFTDTSVPAAIDWAGNITGKPITEITENSGVISFAFMGGNNPGNFLATALSSNEIQLEWEHSQGQTDVLLAYNTENTFGAPIDGSTYTAGGTLTGGGEILYNGTGITFNHLNLLPLTRYYYKAYTILANNEYSSGTTIAATTHCANELEMTFQPATINFDNTFIGDTSFLSLMIYNIGCTDTLHVSSISSTLNIFQTGQTSTNVKPQDSAEILIAFNPDQAITYNESISILSNYADTSIAITGTGIEPPVIAVSPAEFTIQLDAGSVSSEYMTINNTGNSDLNFSNSISYYSNSQPSQNIGFYADETRNSPVKNLGNINNGQTKDGFEINNSSNSSGDILDEYQYFPSGSAGMVWVEGNLYVVSYSDQCVYTYDTLTQTSTHAFHLHGNPFGIAWDGNNLWIGDGNGNIYGYSISGTLLGSFSSPISSYVNLTWDGSSFIVRDMFNGGDFFAINYTGSILHAYSCINPAITESHVYVPNHFSGKTWAYSRNDGMLYQLKNNNNTLTIQDNFPISTAEAFSLTHCGTDLWFSSWFGPLQKIDDGYHENWITLSPSDGTVGSQNMANINLGINATGLLDGLYTANIAVSSNDPVNPMIIVPFALNVSGIPDIAVSTTSINFGQVFQGGLISDTLIIYNNGTKELTISSASTTNTEFSVLLTMAVIEPGDSLMAPIRFTPSAIGSFNSVVSVESDDPDTPLLSVSLFGEGILPPIISLSTDTVLANLACNDTIVRIVDIANSGENNLIIRDVKRPYSPDSITTTFVGGNGSNGNMFDIIANELLRINEFKINVQTTETANIEIYYKSGSYVGYENNPAAWTLVTSESITGAGTGNPTPVSINSLELLAGQTYGIYIKCDNYSLAYTDGSNTYSNDHLTIEAGVGVNGSFGTVFTPRSWNGSIVYESSINLRSWLSYSLLKDTIASGNSSALSLTFNAEALNAGDYYDTLSIYSNDPATPVQLLPCQLSVTGEPEISLIRSNIVFGDVYAGQSRTDTLIISNTGYDTLAISNFSVTGNAFCYFANDTSIIPGNNLLVPLVFSPETVGSFHETLSFESNAPQQNHLAINLLGQALAPPVLSINPESVYLTIAPGDSALQQITITNTGGVDLEFSFSDYAEQSLVESMDKVIQPFLDVAKGEEDPRIGSKVLWNSGGPDIFGYSWTDSDGPGGPTFNWQDISSTGTLVTGLTDDSYVGSFPMGFDFPFYENSYNEFFITSNGLITFGTSSTSLSNQAIPNSNMPNNFIAWCWDDLYPRGTVHYQQFSEYLVIQFTDYGEFGNSSSAITSQVILYKSGKIKIQYLNTVNGFDILGCTVGIENANGTDGLQIAFNTSYIHDSLAVEISSVGDWITVVPATGTLAPGASADVEIGIDATGLACGRHIRNLNINSNDPSKLVYDYIVAVNVVVSQEFIDDSLALVAFYSATNGDNWNNNTSWLTGPLYTWFGVSILKGQITKLELPGNNLNGYIPNEIGELSNLTVLNLRYNNGLNGTSIPDSIVNLENLTDLNLYNNGHSGSIPESIGNLRALEYLDLAANWNLSGAVPASIGNLTNLSYLNLWGNQLTGTIPAEIGNLSNLYEIKLSDNQLTGSIPIEIGNLSDLGYLSLSNNQLSGNIPAQLGNLNLWGLYLGNNQLEGEIPSSFENVSFWELQLHNNKLSGDLPSSLVQMINDPVSIPEDLHIATNPVALYLRDGSLATTVEKDASLNVQYRLRIENNKFTFANLETSSLAPGSIDKYTYAPQDTLLGIVQNELLLTALDCGNASNLVNWYRNGSLVNENSQTCAAEATGNYSFVVTNSGFPDLTLYSDTLYVEVQSIQVHLQVTETNLSDGETACFNALETITVAGTGTVIVEPGASANFIAGQSIRFLPGFHAHAGSTVNAWITTDAAFCDALPAPIMAAEPLADKSIEFEKPEPEEDVFEKQSIVVYPNPNNGQFTLSLYGFDGSTRVLIFNAMGQRVYDAGINGQTHTIELPNIQRGIYFVKAINNGKQFDQKMLVQ